LTNNTQSILHTYVIASRVLSSLVKQYKLGVAIQSDKLRLWIATRRLHNLCSNMVEALAMT